MRITDDIRKFAAENGMDEAEVLEEGMAEKSREFIAQGGEVYSKV
jgi:phosphomethylpyrimidine synthase